MRDRPFYHVWPQCNETKTKGYRYIRALRDGPDPLIQDLDDIKSRRTASTGTKFVTYATQINPQLLPHPMYTEKVRLPYESHRTVTGRLMNSRTTWQSKRKDGRVHHMSSDYAKAKLSKQKNIIILLKCELSASLRSERNFDFPNLQSLFEITNAQCLCKTFRNVYIL